MLGSADPSIKQKAMNHTSLTITFKLPSNETRYVKAPLLSRPATRQLCWARSCLFAERGPGLAWRVNGV
eukprot:scaffold16081_cov15-Prasinocladus_malaysianus.AAC.1